LLLPASLLKQRQGEPMPRTVIRASHIIAYQDGGHRHLKDGVVVYEGDTIVHVGQDYDGPSDHVIDAKDKVVTPGFINTHAHLSESPLDKSFVEDRGPRQFYLSGLFEFLSARDGAITDAARRASIAYSIPELLRTGTTTIMEIGRYGDVVAEHAARSGIRAYIGQGYRSGRWYTANGRTVDYEWDEDDGVGAFNDAVSFIERVDGAGEWPDQGLPDADADRHLLGSPAAPLGRCIAGDEGAVGTARLPIRA
jgi:5-methylthioadenosine/S-adenosylhomocysteine deaminase